MDEISALLVVKALDGLSMRASAIAQNIANAGTPSYRAVGVNFEAELRQAAEGGADRLRNFEPHFNTGQRAGGGVRLDMEMAAASQTALRYSALIDVLSRKIALSRLALEGGQR